MRPPQRRIDEAIAAAEALAARRQPPVCVLCGRPIPPEARSSRHHLIPRLKGGTHKGTVRLHQICHNAIHARFSEAELARRVADGDSLRADPELAAFIRWVADKPPTFHAPTRMTRALRAARKLQ
jgi:hypothetical protein